MLRAVKSYTTLKESIPTHSKHRQDGVALIFWLLNLDFPEKFNVHTERGGRKKSERGKREERGEREKRERREGGEKGEGGEG